MNGVETIPPDAHIFIARVRELGRTDAIGFIYSDIDDALRSGKFAYVDAVMAAVPLDLPNVILLGFLSITRSAEGRVKYAPLYARIREHLAQVAPIRFEAMLLGFEPDPEAQRFGPRHEWPKGMCVVCNCPIIPTHARGYCADCAAQ